MTAIFSTIQSIVWPLLTAELLVQLTITINWHFTAASSFLDLYSIIISNILVGQLGLLLVRHYFLSGLHLK